jgi:hypothetical protein
MQPASADKRFRAQLAERNVAVRGLAAGVRKHMHDLAHKYRKQIGRPYAEIKPEPIWSGDRPTRWRGGGGIARSASWATARPRRPSSRALARHRGSASGWQMGD